MRAPMLFGVCMILAGAAMVGFEQFSYNTREKALEIGAVTATAEDTKTVRVPPVLGAALMGSGVLVLIVTGLRRNLTLRTEPYVGAF